MDDITKKNAMHVLSHFFYQRLFECREGILLPASKKKVKFRFCNHHLCYVVRAAATEVFVTIGLNVD